MELKDWIRSVRQSLKLSQSSFGDEFSVTKGNVSSWENGRHSPSFEQLARMSEMSGMALPGGTTAPPAPVTKVPDLSGSSNSQTETDSPHSPTAPTITYATIRKVVAGTLQGFGIRYEDLVPDDPAAQQRIGAALRLAVAPQADTKEPEKGAQVIERRREDRRKAETWRINSGAPRAPKKQKRNQEGSA